MKSSAYVSMAAAVAAGLFVSSAAKADTFVPGDPVDYAANFEGQFTVNSSDATLQGGLYGTNSFVSVDSMTGVANPNFALEAGANPGSYADAGVVLYFNGGLTLGQLQSVNISTIGGNTTPSVNLWLDSGGDNNFFAFSGDQFTGLAGDSYFGATTAGNVNGATTFTHLGGLGSGNYTLAQLQQGAVPGIDANTKTALWVGITNGDYWNYNWSSIGKIDVAAVPLPAAASMGLMLLAGIGGVGALKRMRRHAV